jgi:hypothetical protein
VLAGEWEFGIALDNLPDADKTQLTPYLAELGIPASFAKPELYLVYKTGAEYPKHPTDAPTVERDLKIHDDELRLDGEARIGYYLKPQGRDGPNRTEQYLTRQYPRGRGYIDPFLSNIWG